jgi:GT2 family glycosyltransferase
MNIAVGIATRGRPKVLAETLAELARQTRAPDAVFVCHVDDSDVGDLPRAHPHVTFLRGPPGLPHQRNVILDAVTEADLLLFIDDDFFPAPAWLDVLERVMQAHPGCVVATGTVIADGAKGPGVAPDAARRLLADDTPPSDALAVAPHFNGYGCNMAFRMAPVRAHGIRVDEALPLYAWYEDIDVTRRLAAASGGEILRLAGARGVHLGVKSARTPGLRLGYSQVVNPIYLMRKGSFPWNHAIPSAARHCLINLLRSLRPEPEVDRWGRFRGNLRGLFDLLRGKARPARILEF